MLLSWFLEHKKNPYPNSEQKEQLAHITALDKVQIRNWFTNIRKRHWTPIRNGEQPKTFLDEILLKAMNGKTVTPQELDAAAAIAGGGGVAINRMNSSSLTAQESNLLFM